MLCSLARPRAANATAAAAQGRQMGGSKSASGTSTGCRGAAGKEQRDTQAFLQENGVQTESWGPFAEGRNDIFNNEVLRAIAQEHGRTVAQVIVRWLTQRGVVAIPKSVRRERMEENFQVFDFSLTAANMDAIASLDTASSSFFDHRDPAMVKTLSEAQRPT